VMLLENDQGKNAVLVSTVWDTADDAERFFTAMDEWFRRHYPNMQKSSTIPAGFSIIQNGELSLIRQNGPSVRFIIGLPEADGKKLKSF